MRILLGLAVVFGCTRAEGPDIRPPDPALERHATKSTPSPTAPLFARPQIVRWHMHQHFDDLRTIEHHLISGQLDEAKALAFMLTRPVKDPGMERWEPETVRVAQDASVLTRVQTADEAYAQLPRVAQTCASCHERTRAQIPINVERPGNTPATRHRWAVDRLWLGLIAPSDVAWRTGLEMLATSDPPAAGESQLRDVAKRLLDANTDHVVAYGKLLATCGGCHARTSTVASVH